MSPHVDPKSAVQCATGPLAVIYIIFIRIKPFGDQSYRKDGGRVVLEETTPIVMGKIHHGMKVMIAMSSLWGTGAFTTTGDVAQWQGKRIGRRWSVCLHARQHFNRAPVKA